MVIAAFTLSGHTARLLSHYRPAVPIVAFSPNQEVRRKLSLLWGVVPRVLEPVDRTEEMIRRVEEELLSRGLAHRGDRVVIVYGAPWASRGRSTAMRLHEIRLSASAFGKAQRRAVPERRRAAGLERAVDFRRAGVFAGAFPCTTAQSAFGAMSR